MNVGSLVQISGFNLPVESTWWCGQQCS